MLSLKVHPLLPLLPFVGTPSQKRNTCIYYLVLTEYFTIISKSFNFFLGTPFFFDSQNTQSFMT